jgi:Fuc2NAc and GlcNAc transferase
VRSAAWCLLVLPVASAALTGVLRRYAMAHRLLDVPNERSSHVAPTPRGGGLAIVLTFLTVVLAFAASGVVSTRVVIALIGGGTAVAVVGFFDDHRSVAARWRLLTHFSATVWVLFWLGGVPPLIVLGIPVEPWWLRDALAAVGMVWLLNLYNFMDGIDGIAGIEAVTAGTCAAFILLLRPSAGQEWLLPAALALSTIGFLVWNWPPAKVFMGDVGSGFLGLTIGVLAVHAAWIAPELLWSWTILVGVFVVDATLTLFRRLQRGEKPHEAHRSHAYQHAARRFGSHQRVTLTVAAINVGWLFPIALVVGLGKLNGLAGLLIAYAPLVGIALRYKAGTGAFAAEARTSRGVVY